MTVRTGDPERVSGVAAVRTRPQNPVGQNMQTASCSMPERLPEHTPSYRLFIPSIGHRTDKKEARGVQRRSWQRSPTVSSRRSTSSAVILGWMDRELGVFLLPCRSSPSRPRCLLIRKIATGHHAIGSCPCQGRWPVLPVLLLNKHTKHDFRMSDGAAAGVSTVQVCRPHESLTSLPGRGSRV